MQLSRSNWSWPSVLRNRQNSTRSAGSITTKGSIDSRFLALIFGPNFCSQTAMISAAVMAGYLLSGLGGGGQFLGSAGEGVLFLHRLDRIGVAQFRRQQDVAGPRGNRHVDGL